MRILVATAVPAERDAVARALPGPTSEVRLPAATLHRYRAVGHDDGPLPSGHDDGALPSGHDDGPSAADPGHGSPAADPGHGSPAADPGHGSPAAGHGHGTPPDRRSAPSSGLDVDLLAAGVGPALAAASAAGALTAAVLEGRPYGLVVSTGIAGGFLPEAPLGCLVLADEITAADLGADTPDGFLPVTDLGFGTVTHHPPQDLVRAAAAATGARTGTVLTVSTVTGSAERAAALRARHPRALAEAMEGFGVAEAAAAHTTPVLELRAVSNAVGPRDRAAWRIGDALTALTEAFGKLTPVLESWDPYEPYEP
ncbi:futalosine hydrolase [Streptomyces sp. NBC_00487]|uniref:futalosine hydrolase n=1 Tax=unclassified Streptomyces TaxID=2593676 RepID=UPI002E17362C|nr:MULTISPECIES: futalosine hydrolase [unclassified Streptomyces]